MSPTKLSLFASLGEASRALAGFAAGVIRAAIEARGVAFMALPGGATPAAFLTDLSTSEIDWDRVILMPTDERDVPVDHPRSNEGMMRALLSPLGEGRCGFVSLRRAGMPPHAAAAAAAADLRELGPLDLLISGMGDDAHVASLFPSDTVWHDAGEALVLAAAPRSLEPRISLGPAALKAAREVALLIAGPAKLAALDGAMAVRDEREAPVRLLLRGGRTLQVFASRDP